MLPLLSRQKKIGKRPFRRRIEISQSVQITEEIDGKEGKKSGRTICSREAKTKNFVTVTDKMDAHPSNGRKKGYYSHVKELALRLPPAIEDGQWAKV